MHLWAKTLYVASRGLLGSPNHRKCLAVITKGVFKASKKFMEERGANPQLRINYSASFYLRVTST